MSAILQHFGIDESAHLGHGGEARVYALDDARVLRVYHESHPDALALRAAFYEEARGGDVSFDIPLVLDYGEVARTSYSIERRIKGRSLWAALFDLHGEDRITALHNYLWAAEEVQRLPVRRPYFGEIIGLPVPMRAATWREYLLARFDSSLPKSRGDLEADVPSLDAVVATARRRLESLDEPREARLVHGDYFPGNVIIGDDLRVTGVIDFSWLTVIGDPRMDTAGAVLFLDHTDSSQPGDLEMLTDIATEKYGTDFPAVIDAYRGYYAVYFAQFRYNDEKLYQRCAATLRRLRLEPDAA